jgi:lysozyme family protein
VWTSSTSTSGSTPARPHAQFRKALDPLKLAPVEYVKKHSAKRLSFLHGLKTWSVFGKGWGKRVADVEAFGIRLAVGSRR